MTPEAQRIAIAEARGMQIVACTCCANPFKSLANGKHIPDHLNDLNAMHEAVKSLPQNIKPRYFAHLCTIVSGAISLHGYSEATEATAAQRAEAFLRTIGKWVYE